MDDRRGGMAIVRAERDRQYEILPVALLRDPRLSFRARGIAARLLTNVDGYRMTAEDLARQSPTDRGEGRDGILTALKELERAGYLIRRRRQTEKGWWITESTLHSTPQEPTPVQPTPAEPTPVEPNSGQPGVGSAGANNSSTNIITNSTTTTCSPGPQLHFPVRMGEQERVVVVGFFEELGLSVELQEQLVDELTGKMASPHPPINPIVWLRAVALRARDGKYTPAYALQVAAERQRRAEAATTAERKRQAAADEAARRKAEQDDPAAVARRLAQFAEITARLGGGPSAASTSSP